MPRKYRGWTIERLKEKLNSERLKSYVPWPSPILDTSTSSGTTYYRIRERDSDGKPGRVIKSIPRKDWQDLKKKHATGKEIHLLQVEIQSRLEAQYAKDESQLEYPNAV